MRKNGGEGPSERAEEVERRKVKRKVVESSEVVESAYTNELLAKACAQVEKLVQEVAEQRKLLLWLLEKHGYVGDATVDPDADQHADSHADLLANLVANVSSDLPASPSADLPVNVFVDLPASPSADSPADICADLHSTHAAATPAATPVREKNKKADIVFTRRQGLGERKKGAAVKEPYTDPDRHKKKKGV